MAIQGVIAMTIRSIFYGEYISTTTYSAGAYLQLATASNTDTDINKQYFNFISGLVYAISGNESYVLMSDQAASTLAFPKQEPLSKSGGESFVGVLCGNYLALTYNPDTIFYLAGV